MTRKNTEEKVFKKICACCKQPMILRKGGIRRVLCEDCKKHHKIIPIQKYEAEHGE